MDTTRVVQNAAYGIEDSDENSFGFDDREHGYLVPGRLDEEAVYVPVQAAVTPSENHLPQNIPHSLKLVAATHKDGTLRIRCHDGDRVVFEGNLPPVEGRAKKNTYQKFINDLLRGGASPALRHLLVYSHKNPSSPLKMALLDLFPRSMTEGTEDSGFGGDGGYADVEGEPDNVYAMGNMPDDNIPDEDLYVLGNMDGEEAVYDMASDVINPIYDAAGATTKGNSPARHPTDSRSRSFRNPQEALLLETDVDNHLPLGYLDVSAAEEDTATGKKPPRVSLPGEVVYEVTQGSGSKRQLPTVPEGLYSVPGGPSASARRSQKAGEAQTNPKEEPDDGIYDNQRPGQLNGNEGVYQFAQGPQAGNKPSVFTGGLYSAPSDPSASASPLDPSQLEINKRSILVFPCGHMCPCSTSLPSSCGQNCPPPSQALKVTFPPTAEKKAPSFPTRAYGLLWGEGGWRDNFHRRAATMAVGAAGAGGIAASIFLTLGSGSQDSSSQALSQPSCPDLFSPNFNGDLEIQGAYQELTTAVEAFPGVSLNRQFFEVVASGVGAVCTMGRVVKDVTDFVQIAGVGFTCRTALGSMLAPLSNISFNPLNIRQAKQVVVNTGNTANCKATTSTKPTTTKSTSTSTTTSTQRTSTSKSTTTTKSTSTSTTSTQEPSTSTSTTTTKGTSTSTTTSTQEPSTSTSTTTPEASTSTSTTTSTQEPSTSTSTTTTKGTSTSTTTSTQEPSTSTSTTTTPEASTSTSTTTSTPETSTSTSTTTTPETSTSTSTSTSTAPTTTPPAPPPPTPPPPAPPTTRKGGS